MLPFLLRTCCLLLLTFGVVVAQPLRMPANPSKAQKHLAAQASSSTGGTFAQHDHVPVLLNKVGPYSNPHETYRYLHLPFCKGKAGSELEHQDIGHSLGELFAGDRKQTSNYDITFRDDINWRVLCSRTLGAEDIQLFRKAVEEDETQRQKPHSQCVQQLLARPTECSRLADASNSTSYYATWPCR